MQMDVLRCKTPAMVRKEIWGHLLVYNLLRATMAQAALRHGVGPRQVSLQGTRQTVAAFHSLLAQATSTEQESIVLYCSLGHRASPCGNPAGPLRAARVQATPETVPPPESPTAASPCTLGNSRVRPRKRHSGQTPIFPSAACGRKSC
jgi:hypothetical protein